MNKQSVNGTLLCSTILRFNSIFLKNIMYTVVQISITCGIFTAIWLIFFLFECIEAKKINQKLKELEKDDWE